MKANDCDTMQPMGYDTIVFTCADPTRILRSVVDRIQAKHGEVEFDLDFFSPHAPGPTGLDTEGLMEALRFTAWNHVVIDIYENRSIRKHLDEHAYTPSPEGGGPLALHIRQRRGVAFGLGAVREIQPIEGPIGPPDPYEAWFCSPTVYELTIVTYDDPRERGECNSFVEMVIACCATPDGIAGKVSGSGM